MTAPEPCLNTGSFGGCRSPVACEGWGYCRERNKDDRGAPPHAVVYGRRITAKRRKRKAHEREMAE